MHPGSSLSPGLSWSPGAADCGEECDYYDVTLVHTWRGVRADE